MLIKFRNLILNELFYLVSSVTFVLILVVARGIFFDRWYKDWENILKAGAIIYGLTFLYRLLSWLIRTSKRIADKKNK